MKLDAIRHFVFCQAYSSTVFIKILPLDIYSAEESQNVVCRSNRSILLVGFKPELVLRLQATHFNEYSYCYYSFMCEISSSHGGEYDVQSCFLGPTAV
jgi:hypothetical protein